MLAFLSLFLAPAAAASPALREASASLDGRSQCVRFDWLANEKGSAKGGIAVPVRINGQAMRLQLDTGADVTSLYGRFPVTAGWAKAGDETFRAATLEVAGTRIARPRIWLNPDMDEDPGLRGTLGLPAHHGRVAVIDYPGQRFCLFDEADLPLPIDRARTTRAMLRNAKFHVPVTIGSFASDTIVFDTGSSETPLFVDLADWKAITGRTTTDGAPASLAGMAWGKPFTMAGAPSATGLKLGRTDLGPVTVFTNPANPASFADWPVPTTGILGNAPLWDGIVVMDLTANMRFGYIR